jgi:hypothetical protein
MIRHGQLKQEPIAPVKVGLSPAPGTNHQVKAFSLFASRLDAGLIKAALATFHAEEDSAIACAQFIMARSKRAGDGLRAGSGGCPGMRGAGIRRRDGTVAKGAIQSCPTWRQEQQRSQGKAGKTLQNRLLKKL